MLIMSFSVGGNKICKLVGEQPGKAVLYEFHNSYTININNCQLLSLDQEYETSLVRLGPSDLGLHQFLIQIAQAIGRPELKVPKLEFTLEGLLTDMVGSLVSVNLLFERFMVEGDDLQPILTIKERHNARSTAAPEPQCMHYVRHMGPRLEDFLAEREPVIELPPDHPLWQTYSEPV